MSNIISFVTLVFFLSVLSDESDTNSQHGDLFKGDFQGQMCVQSLCLSTMRLCGTGAIASIPINDNAKSLVCEFANESS